MVFASLAEVLYIRIQMLRAQQPGTTSDWFLSTYSRFILLHKSRLVLVVLIYTILDALMISLQKAVVSTPVCHYLP